MHSIKHFKLKKFVFRHLLICGYIFFSFSQSALAQRHFLKRLDFEDRSHIGRRYCYKSRWCLVDDFFDNDKKYFKNKYGTDIKGKPNKPWKSYLDPYKGQASLALQYPANLAHPPGDQSQKLEYWIGQQDFYKTWWTGFAVKIGSGRQDNNIFENPSEPGKWVIVSQWWQGNGIPPMKLEIKNPGFKNSEKELVWQLRIHNNNNTQVSNGMYAKSKGGQVAFQGKITKENWHTFIIESKFVPIEAGKTSKGYLRIWQNGQPIVQVNRKKNETKWTGYIGYNRTKNKQPPGLVQKGLDKLAFKIGIYRKLQNKNQTIYFDQISISDNENGFSIVDPIQW